MAEVRVDLRGLRATSFANVNGKGDRKRGRSERPLIFRTPQSEDNPRAEVFDGEASAIHGGVQRETVSGTI